MTITAQNRRAADRLGAPYAYILGKHPLWQAPLDGSGRRDTIVHGSPKCPDLPTSQSPEIVDPQLRDLTSGKGRQLWFCRCVSQGKREHPLLWLLQLVEHIEVLEAATRAPDDGDVDTLWAAERELLTVMRFTRVARETWAAHMPDLLTWLDTQSVELARRVDDARTRVSGSRPAHAAAGPGTFVWFNAFTITSLRNLPAGIAQLVVSSPVAHRTHTQELVLHVPEGTAAEGWRDHRSLLTALGPARSMTAEEWDLFHWLRRWYRYLSPPSAYQVILDAAGRLNGVDRRVLHTLLDADVPTDELVSTALALSA